MIVGIGLDMVEIKRMEAVFTRKPRIVARILTAREQEGLKGNARRQMEYLSGRFAAKEALSKALGTGIGRYLHWQDVSIVRGALGKPEVIVEHDRSGRLHGVTIHLSITHERTHTMAVVILERPS
ncbi:MAG: holo-ACP synthase [Candidatus Carbobacillus altaicus]|uniref:Holo-[acyl-carrier-protein] synthase n=1 Tax=Candidatus Carbonibacillus altaicus TaxID=2163959 RepID=A0A2R6Y013_9BACL|nr:holo-ACP synthase [Candidatus Carbobacillus altaicus]PTQ56007.1 MAG: Holo-[acyl-carrier protein] synthase [Candidatus Carbobacillus altaicus]